MRSQLNSQSNVTSARNSALALPLRLTGRGLESLEPRQLLSSTLPVSDYLDLSAGQSWSYTGTVDSPDLSGGSSAASLNIATTASGSVAGATLLDFDISIPSDNLNLSLDRTLQWTGGNLEIYSEVEQSTAPGFTYTSTETWSTPGELFRTGMNQGQSYAVSSTSAEAENENGNLFNGTNTNNGTVLFEGYEKVSTPAGDFFAAKLVLSNSSTNGFESFSHLETLWVVDELGIVKWMLNVDGSDEIYDFALSSSSNLNAFNAITAPVPEIDFNGDGNADLFWRNAVDGRNRIRLMDGSTVLSTQNVRSLNANWELSGIADLDQDGNLDLLWKNKTSGRNTAWFLDSSNNFERSAVVSEAGPDWRAAAIADMNGDGNMDIVWEKNDGSSRSIWHLGGNEGITRISTSSLDGLSSVFRISGAADLNQDGEADLIYRRINSNVTQVAMMSGAARDGTFQFANKGDRWHIGGLGDFDDDGTLDIIWRDTATGRNQVRLDDTTLEVIPLIGTNWHLPGTDLWYE